MALNRQRMHGRFELAVDGNLLVNRSWGPWNREHILVYREDLGRLIESLAGTPWGMLAFLSKEPLHTPDSLAEMVAAIRHQRTQGRRGTAVLLVDVEAPGIVKSVLSRMYTEAGEPFIFADDEAHARAWLAQRLDPQAS